MSESWVQTVTIIASLGGLMYWLIQRLEKDIGRVDGDIKGLSTRMDGHASRIDQLYVMFIELVKSGKS